MTTVSLISNNTNIKTTRLTVLHQGDVKLSHLEGYLVKGNDEAVCFWIDVQTSAFVTSSSRGENGCPMVYLAFDDNDDPLVETEVEFSDFSGWEVHAGGGGKSIAIALTKQNNF